MKHLVVGIDGSASSEMAVHWASAVASATGARISVAHVVDDGDHEDVSARFVLTAGRPAMLLDAVSTNPVRSDYEVLHGDPPTRILELATGVRADMIVIGRRVHRPAAPRLLGSFTRQLLQRNELPVVVVPAPSEQLPRPDLTATAVVGLDGTESARSVLSCALSLSEAVGLDMDVLTTVDLHGEPGSDTGKLERRDVRSVQRLLREMVSTVDPQRIRHVNAHAEVGVASDELLRRSRYAELLVVGHKRRSPIGRFLSHATGRYCASHSTCPVVMVPIEPPRRLQMSLAGRPTPRCGTVHEKIVRKLARIDAIRRPDGGLFCLQGLLTVFSSIVCDSVTRSETTPQANGRTRGAILTATSLGFNMRTCGGR